MYGAKKGKILNMFIDDLSLPQRDQYGTQEVNEVSLTLHLFPLDLIFATEMRLEYTVRHKKFVECRFFVFLRTKCCDQSVATSNVPDFSWELIFTILCLNSLTFIKK